MWQACVLCWAVTVSSVLPRSVEATIWCKLADRLTNASLWDRARDYMPDRVLEKMKLSEPKVGVRMNLNFEDMQDTAEFYYQSKNRWRKMGVPYNFYFRLDHFAGCRIGLFNYVTKELDGEVVFREFRYIYEE